MAIKVTTSETVLDTLAAEVKDSLPSVLEGLSPAAVSFNFFLDEKEDLKSYNQCAALAKAVEETEVKIETMNETDPTLDAERKKLIALVSKHEQVYLKAFGRETGSPNPITGSFLYRLNKALETLQAQKAWIGADYLSKQVEVINDDPMSTERFRVTVLRSRSKLTKSKRPSLAARQEMDEREIERLLTRNEKGNIETV